MNGLNNLKRNKIMEMFSKANQGSNDYLLMQQSIQFGFKLAMESISKLIEDKEI